MKQLSKNIVKYSLCFIGLYLCSIITLNIFSLCGIKYDSISNTSAVASIIAMCFLIFIHYKQKLKKK